jgi:hypothetical protein
MRETRVIGSMRGCRVCRVIVASALAMIISCGPGCDRIGEWAGNLSFKKGGKKQEDETFSDRQRVLRKFGEPHERVGIGKRINTENGIKYNRKWNYHYSSTDPKMSSMRTVYFVDDKFSGSVIRQPDGNVIKERIKFPY